MNVIADFYFDKKLISSVNYGSLEWEQLFEEKLKFNRQKTTTSFFARVIVPVLVLCGASITTTVVGRTYAYNIYVQDVDVFRSNMQNLLLSLERNEMENE